MTLFHVTSPLASSQVMVGIIFLCASSHGIELCNMLHKVNVHVVEIFV